MYPASDNDAGVYFRGSEAGRGSSPAIYPYDAPCVPGGLCRAAEPGIPRACHHIFRCEPGKRQTVRSFLLSVWGTLTARMRPLLTETVVRSLACSDFTPEEIITSTKPVTVYLHWKEQDLLALSPLVRLLWGILIDELVTIYDSRTGSGWQPVMLLIDEAGQTAIPSLADHATSVVGRGISIWLALQSLSQLEVVYGKARAQVLGTTWRASCTTARPT
jgi:type IV secretory pathway TraG/TraD family ATPase VirD4